MMQRTLTTAARTALESFATPPAIGFGPPMSVVPRKRRPFGGTEFLRFVPIATEQRKLD